MNKTLEYYDKNAESFTSSTQKLTFSGIQDRFLAKLNSDACILDFGCGTGRDTKYFLDHGYQTEATDGSEAMVKAASALTGINVRKMLFSELSEKERYDGIWACSSILHCSRKELPDILKRMQVALKNNGVIYTSFKYGNFEGERNGRYFTDFTEDSFNELLYQVKGLKCEDMWISSDIRPGRQNEKWLNVILRNYE